MKPRRSGWSEGRHNQLLDDPRQDSYRAPGKLPDPTRCPQCSATYQQGRWTWASAAAGAAEALCPACLRTRDGFPAGYVTFSGEFLAAHRDEVLRLVRHCEEEEMADHPLQRIIGTEEAGGELVVTTTDVHIARRIAESVHSAFKKSQIELQYSEGDNLLRARVTR